MMTTTADEKVMEAKDKLSEAYKALLFVIDEDTHGYNEFSKDYIDSVHEVLITILKCKRIL